jgi:hypothetical protein
MTRTIYADFDRAGAGLFITVRVDFQGNVFVVAQDP